MKRAWTLAALTLAACTGGTPPIPFESAAQRPLKPGEASSIVRRTNDDHRDQIAHIAVSDQHIFFATQWDGVYRVPKYGGAVVAVERDPDAVYAGLTSNGTDVFTLRLTFGANDAPTTQIRRRGEAATGPSQVLDRGDFATLSSNVVDNLAVDGNHLFVVRTIGPVDANNRQPAAIDRYSLAGSGAPARVLASEDVFGLPSWAAAGDGGIAFAACDRETCAIKLTDGSAEPRMLGSLDWSANVAAADAGGVYVTKARGIDYVSRDGSPVRSLLATPDGVYIDRPAVVDAKAVYAIRYTSAGTEIISVAKDTGAVSVLADGAQLQYGIWEIAQDDDNLFLLRAGVEILRLPKVRLKA